MAINLPQFSEDMDIIQKLGDTPGTDNNLDWKQLQAKFDEAGNLLKAYLNKVIPEINSAFSKEGNVITGGTMIGDIDVNGNRMFGLKNPEADSDAVSKKYMEDAISAVQKLLLPLAGGTMAGSINMGGNGISGLAAPERSDQAVNKDYVDGKRMTFTATLGTTWTGDGPFSQSVALAEILATDIAHISPIYDATNSVAIVQKEAWANVSSAITVNGGIKFVCFEDKPETEISIQIEVMR